MYMGVGSNPTSDTDFFFFFFPLLSSYGPSPPAHYQHHSCSVRSFDILPSKESVHYLFCNLGREMDEVKR